MGSLLRKLLKGTAYALGGLMLWSAANMGFNNTLQTYYSLKPDQTRESYKQRYGHSISGYEPYLGKDRWEVPNIVSIIERESLEGGLNLKSLRYEPSNFLKKNLLEQLSFIFTGGYEGYAIGSHITLTEDASYETVTHELKHNKTYQVLKQHPEFKERWERIAQDSTGKTGYVPWVKYGLSNLRLVGNLFCNSKGASFKDGYVSGYARTNFYEDVAELATEIEDHRIMGWFQFEFFSFVMDSSDSNSKLRAKMDLLIEYGLVPPETFEFYQIKQTFWDGIEMRSVSREKGERFLKESEEFLEKHPRSTFAQTVHSGRAWVISELLIGENPYQDALEECKKAVKYPVADITEYPCILDRMHDLYLRLGDPEKAGVMKEAIKRYENMDDKVEMVTDGANRFLAEKGILER